MVSLYVADANECNLGTHGCTSTFPSATVLCADTIGSYTCSCSLGFVIDTDGLTCIGRFYLRFLVAVVCKRNVNPLIPKSQPYTWQIRKPEKISLL